MLADNIKLNKIIKIFNYFILNIYIAKDLPASIFNSALILSINNIKAIEGNISNKNGIPNLAIEEEEEINKKKKKKPKEKEEKDRNILKKALPESKIIKIKKFIIIISVYIYYNILIFSLFNIIKI